MTNYVKRVDAIFSVKYEMSAGVDFNAFLNVVNANDFLIAVYKKNVGKTLYAPDEDRGWKKGEDMGLSRAQRCCVRRFVKSYKNKTNFFGNVINFLLFDNKVLYNVSACNKVIRIARMTSVEEANKVVGKLVELIGKVLDIKVEIGNGVVVHFKAFYKMVHKVGPDVKKRLKASMKLDDNRIVMSRNNGMFDMIMPRDRMDSVCCSSHVMINEDVMTERLNQYFRGIFKCSSECDMCYGIASKSSSSTESDDYLVNDGDMVVYV